MRRALAAASATAMAGAALVVGGAGAASAEPLTVSGTTAAVAGNYMSYERTVSNSAPVYGDVVTISGKIQRHGWANTATLTSMRNLHPECFKYVPNSASWTVSGKTYDQSSNPNEVNPTARYLELDPPGLWETTPFVMRADFTVLCDAGPVPSGGLSWNSALAGQGSDSNSEKVGPTITVQRKGTQVWLAQPVNPEVNQQVTLRATTNNVPDGGVVSFSVDGAPVGTGPVSGGQATLEWTPTTAGTKQVTATFGQTPTHGGSTSQDRTIVVSPTNVASTVDITTTGDLKVGLGTRITATVSPAGAGGEVEFFEDNNPIGRASVDADGKASIDWIPSVAGERTIDAKFSGRTGVNPSTKGLAVAVAEAAPDAQSTTTTLADVESVQVGQETMLKATVTAGQAGGTVTFYDGSAVIGTAPVQSDGTATLPWTPETDGDRTIRAAYSGHGVYLASQDTKSVFIAPKVVNPDPDPDPGDPTEPGTGSLGSLTGSGGGDNASGSLGSLSSFGS